MKSYDGEKLVLRAIEGQFRTEDPQLVACFLAFNSVTPQDQPLEGQHRRHSRLRRHANIARYRLLAKKIAIATSVLLAVIGVTMVFLLASVSQ
jgi:hypothetical protein